MFWSRITVTADELPGKRPKDTGKQYTRVYLYFNVLLDVWYL